MTDKQTLIIRAGMDLWRAGGESAVSARKISHSVGMTHSGVLYLFDNAARMRAAIAAAAVTAGDAGIIRQLIVAGHPAVAGMDQATRQGWLQGV